MRWSAKTRVLVGLGVGVAASGTAALWLYEHPNTSAPVWRQAADATAQGAPKDIATLETEVVRLKADKDQLAQLSSEMKSDLTALHSQLAQVDRDQESTGHRLNQVAEKMGRVGLDGSTVPAARDDNADSAPLTPEEESQREAAQTQAEIGLLEGTLRAEKLDPAWASTAQLALSETFQREAIPGARLVGAECRTTLCRMDLSFEGSTPEDSFRHMTYLSPWAGQSLVQIDTEAGVAVMYLAREEHALPQLTE